MAGNGPGLKSLLIRPNSHPSEETMTTQKPASDGLGNREPETGALDDTDLEKVNRRR